MKKIGIGTLVAIAAIGLFFNAQRKGVEKEAKKQQHTEVTSSKEQSSFSTAEDHGTKNSSSSKPNEQKTAYEATNQAFIKAYFTYGSYKERQTNSEPLLTTAAKKEVQLSVFDPNEIVQSIVFDSNSFYKEESETYVSSLNEIQYKATMNEIESKLSMVYRFTLLYENNKWKVDSVTYVGSRTL